MKSLKFKDIISILEANGFTLVRQAGSHATYKRLSDGRNYVTQVPSSHLSDTCDPGTQRSIIRQSGLEKALFKKS